MVMLIYSVSVKCFVDFSNALGIEVHDGVACKQAFLTEI